MITTVNLLSTASVMKTIGGVLLAIVILLAMVTIHEFGHYIVGKWLGFKINEFSVGFGPAIFKKRSKKTGELFALRIIPLGGYCAFDGEDEDDEPKEEIPTPTESTDEPFAEIVGEPIMQETEDVQVRPIIIQEKKEEYPEPKGERFNNQPPWKRILVLLAGATMNYLLALGLIVVMFSCFGRPVYQVVKNEPPVTETTSVQTVEDEEIPTLKTGDVILKIEGKTMYMITDYLDVLDGKEAGDKVDVLLLRDGKKETVVLTLAADADIQNMSDTSTMLAALGFEAGEGMTTVTVHENPFVTVGNSVAYSWKIGGSVLRSLGELFTGKLSIRSMGGPVTTITVTAEAASNGIVSFLNIAAFIGVNLAVFNLLPVPALDGCKVIFCLIEWIRKKPINRKVEAIIHFAGIIFLFGFAILVDLLQLF